MGYRLTPQDRTALAAEGQRYARGAFWMTEGEFAKRLSMLEGVLFGDATQNGHTAEDALLFCRFYADAANIERRVLLAQTSCTEAQQ